MIWNKAGTLLSLITLLLFCLVGCKYSFNGVSLAPDDKTVSVQRFDNQSAIVVPTLAQNFTEALRDRFISRTRLQLVPANGDLQFSGTIVNYAIEPLTVSGNQASQNRLKVRVRVKYVNKKKPNLNWEQEIEQFADRPAAQSSGNTQAQGEMLEEVQDKLVQDIFNKALSNW